MKSLTLLTFVRNDHELVKPQFERFLRSIRAQISRDFCLIVADISKPELRIPVNDDIQRVYFDYTDRFSPAFIRNNLAIMAPTEYICHVNCDTMYSPNFVGTVLEILNDNNIVFCRRKQVPEVTWLNSVHFVDQAKWEWTTCQFDSYITTGECQAISKSLFMALGGYYRLIKPTFDIMGSAPGFYTKYGDWLTQAYNEDSDIYDRTKQLGIPQVYICDQPDVWILHLGHPKRDSRMEWDTIRG